MVKLLGFLKPKIDPNVKLLRMEIQSVNNKLDSIATMLDLIIQKQDKHTTLTYVPEVTKWVL